MSKLWSEYFWEAWCIASVIGIWPRHIEPRLLKTTHLSLPIAKLSSNLDGLKILHFSDLHWNKHFSNYLKNKITRKAKSFDPDLIFFTGDFLCRANLEHPIELKNFLRSLSAKIGCFAVLGNHDFQSFISVNKNGDYDIENNQTGSTLLKGFGRLFSNTILTGKITKRAQEVSNHQELLSLLNETPFKVLNNTHMLISCRNEWINICGLGEYSSGRFNPNEVFKNFDSQYLGIILSHNPDTFDVLKQFPGELILSGHTHGGQINLPFMWKKFTLIKNQEYKKGLKKIGSDKWGYINRGISSVMKFRWFAPPELTFITLKKGV